MDADKRHQLKTNELADALSKIRTWGNDPQTRWWTLGILVVLVAVIGYRVWGSMRETQISNSWDELLKLSPVLDSDPGSAVDKLKSLIDSAPNEALAVAARVRLASALRQEAITNTDRQTQLLNEAVDVLQPAVRDPNAPAPMVASALYSLATTYESLRELDKAAETYRLLDDVRFAGTPFRAAAAQRAATLSELSAPVSLAPGLPPPASAPATAPSMTIRPAPTSAPATQPSATAPSAPGAPASPTTHPAQPASTQPSAPASPGHDAP